MSDILTAKVILDKENITCVAVYNGQVLSSEEKGIKPILNWMQSDIKALAGRSVADKIVGRAAAFLFIYSGVTEVYGRTMTREAYAMLKNAGISAHYGEICEHILNRRGDDICPMEKAVLNITHPSQAYEALKNAVAKITVK